DVETEQLGVEAHGRLEVGHVEDDVTDLAQVKGLSVRHRRLLGAKFSRTRIVTDGACAGQRRGAVVVSRSNHLCRGVETMADWTPPTQDRAEGYFKELNNWGRWGDADQRGTVNLITPAKRQAAQALVTPGRRVPLAGDVPPH